MSIKDLALTVTKMLWNIAEITPLVVGHMKTMTLEF